MRKLGNDTMGIVLTSTGISSTYRLTVKKQWLNTAIPRINVKFTKPSTNRKMYPPSNGHSSTDKVYIHQNLIKIK